jgi:hypothetical protein
MQLFLAPECLPFAIAAVMLAALTGIEVICLLLGFSLGEAIDKALPDDHGGVLGLLSWLNVGGVPILILIMLFLGIFAMTGFSSRAWRMRSGLRCRPLLRRCLHSFLPSPLCGRRAEPSRGSSRATKATP